MSGTQTVTLTESAWASNSESTQLVGEMWVTTAGSRSSGISHDYTDSYSGTGEYFSLNEGETEDGGTLSESGTWHEVLNLSQSDTLDPVTEAWSTASGSGTRTTTSHNESSYSGGGEYTYLGMQGDYTESGTNKSNDDRTKQYQFENGQWLVSGTGTTTETDTSEYAFSGEGDYTSYSIGTVTGTQSESGQANYDDTQSATWVLGFNEDWQLAAGSGNTTQSESYEYSASGEGTYTRLFDNDSTINGTFEQAADSQWTTGSVTNKAVVNGGWTTIDSSFVAAGSTHTSTSYSGSGGDSTSSSDANGSNTWEDTFSESGGADHTTSFDRSVSYGSEGYSFSSSTTNTNSASGTYAYSSTGESQYDYSYDDDAGHSSSQTSTSHNTQSVTESFSNTSTSTSETNTENGVVTSHDDSSGSSTGSGEANTSSDSADEQHSITDEGYHINTSDWYSTSTGSTHDTYAASGSWSNSSYPDGTYDSTSFQQSHVTGLHTSDYETHGLTTDTWYYGDGQGNSTSTPYSSSEPYSDDYDDILAGGNRFAPQAALPPGMEYGYGYLSNLSYGVPTGEAAPGGGAQYVQPGLPDPSEAPTGTQWVAVGQGGLPTTGILVDPSAIIVMPAITQVSIMDLLGDAQLFSTNTTGAGGGLSVGAASSNTTLFSAPDIEIAAVLDIEAGGSGQLGLMNVAANNAVANQQIAAQAGGGVQNGAGGFLHRAGLVATGAISGAAAGAAMGAISGGIAGGIVGSLAAGVGAGPGAGAGALAGAIWGGVSGAISGAIDGWNADTHGQAAWDGGLSGAIDGGITGTTLGVGGALTKAYTLAKAAKAGEATEIAARAAKPGWINFDWFLKGSEKDAGLTLWSKLVGDSGAFTLSEKAWNRIRNGEKLSLPEYLKAWQPWRAFLPGSIGNGTLGTGPTAAGRLFIPLAGRAAKFGFPVVHPAYKIDHQFTDNDQG